MELGTQIQGSFRAGLIALVLALLLAPSAEAKRLKKSFQSQTNGNELFRRAQFEFVAPIAPDGSDTAVGVVLRFENQCAPFPGTAAPPRITNVELRPKPPTLSDYLFVEDFAPCDLGGTLDPRWVLNDGAEASLFEDPFGSRYCALQLNPPERPAVATCGNGTLNAGERCDDGNTQDGDGCSSICLTEDLRSSAELTFELEPGTLYQLDAYFHSTFNLYPFPDGPCFFIEACLPEIELCGNGIDDDCNGEIDETGCFPDTDGDGTDDTADCAPNDPSIYPGADELCNGVDDNCDAVVDNDPDGDGASYGCDNCPEHFNPGQGDFDGDGLGDACDPSILDPLNAAFGDPAQTLIYDSIFAPARINAGPSGYGACRSAADFWEVEDALELGFSEATSFELAINTSGTPVFGCTDFSTEAILLSGARGPTSAPYMTFETELRIPPSEVGCERQPRDLLINQLFTRWDAANPPRFDIALGDTVPAQLRRVDPLVLAPSNGSAFVRSARRTYDSLEPLLLEYRSMSGRGPEVMGVEVLEAPAAPPGFTAYRDSDGDGLGTAVETCLEPELTPWIGWVDNADDCDDTTSRCTNGCQDSDADGIRRCDGDCNDFDMLCDTCPIAATFADDMENASASESLWTRQSQAQDASLRSTWELTTEDAGSGTRSWRVQNSQGFTFSEATLQSPPITIPVGATLYFDNRFNDPDSCMGTPLLEYSDGAPWITINDWILFGTLDHPDWQEVRVPLNSLAGSTVSFRWRYSQSTRDTFQRDDCPENLPGSWYVDFVRVVGSALYYSDADGDGAGNPKSLLTGCTMPPGYVDNADDACTADPTKSAPGFCGCGVTEIVEFDDSFGIGGNAAGQFNNPLGIAIGDDGAIYISDWNNNRVQVFSGDGVFQRQFDVERPAGIDITTNGWVWVAEQTDDRVKLFDESGSLLDVIGDGSNPDEQLNEPFDLALDPLGKLFVVDRSNHRIQVFDPAGAFQYSFGWGVETGAAALEICNAGCGPGIAGTGKGQFNLPVSIAIDDAGRIYVGGSTNQRVQVFSNDGNFLFTFGKTGSDAGQFNGLVGIDIDGTGRIWVSDFNNHRVQVFSPEGRFQFMLGWGVASGSPDLELCSSNCQAAFSGAGPGQFANASGLESDRQGHLYVTDFSNNRVQIFRTPGSPSDVQGLALDRAGAATRLSWNAQPLLAGDEVVFDVVSGSLSDLRSSRNFDGATSLATGLTSLSLDDFRPTPPVGDGDYYLLRAETPCGVGTFGSSTLTPDPRRDLD